MTGRKRAFAHSQVIRTLALTSMLIGTSACQGDGTFFTAILDGGGLGGIGGGFPIDGGMDARSACTACGDGCFDCGLGCVCDVLDAGLDGGAFVPWVSPFPDTGEPGWQNSTEPLCANVEVDGNAIDIWSDDRGVFALVTGRVPSEQGDDFDAGDGDCSHGNCNIERLFHHNGNAWQLQNTFVIADPEGTIISRDTELRGAPLGPRFVSRFAGEVQDNCAVGLVHDDLRRCVLEQGRARSLFVVNEGRAFVVDGNLGKLLRFEGGGWYELPSAHSPESELCADADRVCLLEGGNPFHVYRFDDRAQPTASATDLGGPTSGEAGSIWVRSPDDIWVGSDAGRIFHFDGQAWQQVATLNGSNCPSADGGVHGIWGSGDTLYFYSARSLMRWNGAVFESLASWTCNSAFNNVAIRDVWGNNDHDLFIALRDIRPFSEPCGGSIVIHFDGAQFHRM